MSEPAIARSRRIPGEPGIWAFILGDMTMFSAFFGQFVYDRQHHDAVFNASQAHSLVTFGAVNTILLLTGSLFVVRAASAARGGTPLVASRWFTLAFATGVVFLFDKVVEWGEKLYQGFNPHSNLYFTYYFMFTGIHALHLIAALCVIAYLRRLCRRPSLDARALRTIEVGASYWHLVDLLWIVLFALLYLMA